MPKTPKRPRDPNQLAKLIVDIATGEATDPANDAPTNRQRAASIAGEARSQALSSEQRTEIAKGAAKKRWNTHKEP